MVKRRPGELTAQEKTFVKHAAATGNLAYAGYKAGYVDPDKHAYRVMARPEVASAVKAEQAKIIERELLPKAVAVHQKILDDALSAKPQMSPKIHVDAVKLAYSYTLGRNADAAEKAPEDMTAEEIAARLAELRAKQERFLQAIPEAEVIDDQPQDQGDIFG